jgi:hypothetical protein
MTPRRIYRTLVGYAAIVAVALSVTHTNVHARSGPKQAEVQLGAPAVWSLEQAHYLLSQMRWRNRMLGPRQPSDTDLDPNATNGVRIEELLTRLGVGVAYDQAAAVQNSLTLDGVRTNRARVPVLERRLANRRSALRNALREGTLLQRKMARLEAAKETADGAGDTARSEILQSEIDRLQAQIDANAAEKAGLESEISSLETDLDDARAGSETSDLAGTAGPETDLDLGTSSIDTLIAANKGTRRLQASMVLDNYIQMQYEIIAKQLTLLRDEAGPDQRIIFLELPTSIYIDPDEADENLAQARWRVEGYFEPSESDDRDVRTVRDDAAAPGGDRKVLRRFNKESKEYDFPDAKQDRAPTCDQLVSSDNWRGDVSKIRAVDLIPRQSALNVADVHKTSKGFALLGKLSTLFGFGATVDYQRQKNTYTEFVNQEIFASAFGKGESEFGWTFGPLPGAENLAPGVRTTYAVLAVPRNAVGIKLRAEGVSYDRDSQAPALPYAGGFSREYTICFPPESGSGFYVTGVEFNQVQSGERATVVLEGDHFSPQIGVLVNGVALRRTVAITDADWLADEVMQRTAGASGSVIGEFEYVNSKRMILTFTMDRAYEGTPVITLVTPERANPINRFRLNINHGTPTNLAEYSLSNPMFIAPLDVTSAQVLSVDPAATGRKSLLHLRGKGFRDDVEVLINGVDVTEDFESPSTLRIGFDAGALRQQVWRVAVAQPTRQGWAEDVFEIANPLVPQVKVVDVLGYAPARGKTPATFDLRVLVEGVDSGYDFIALSGGTNVGQASQLGPGEYFLRVTTPDDLDSVVLEIVGKETQIHRVTAFAQPVPPVVTSIANDTTGKAEGLVDGGYLVTIGGANLQNVTRVYFGTRPADIVRPSAQVLQVMVPKTSEPGPVRVTLETNVLFRGSPVTNVGDFSSAGRSIFVYLPKPKEEPKKEPNTD